MRAASAAPPAREPALPAAGLAPHRTCIGCRRARSQQTLLRLVRTPQGLVEPDPRRRLGGRGAYLCPSEACLTEAVRRGRWAHAFRAPAALPPEAAERLRALIRTGLVAAAPVTESCEVSVKGGC